MSDITLNDLYEAKDAFEKRVIAEVSAAVQDFYNITGLTPSDVSIEMVETTRLNQQFTQHAVSDVEITRDRFPRF